VSRPIPDMEGFGQTPRRIIYGLDPPGFRLPSSGPGKPNYEMSDAPRDATDVEAPSAEPESTAQLLHRARGGDRGARDEVFRRCLPRLRRWASGRLPRWARDVADTHDLVQETLLQTFKNLDRFEPRGELALQAYLRQALVNRVREELRRFARRPGREQVDERLAGNGDSPLEAAIGAETMERYERALERLPERDREVIVARVELGYDYQELATALGRPSAEAARKACERALVRLAVEMRCTDGSR
jgi:RNA polymerase sigma-70 factor, ECF subfamily